MKQKKIDSICNKIHENFLKANPNKRGNYSVADVIDWLIEKDLIKKKAIK